MVDRPGGAPLWLAPSQRAVAHREVEVGIDTGLNRFLIVEVFVLFGVLLPFSGLATWGAAAILDELDELDDLGARIERRARRQRDLDG